MSNTGSASCTISGYPGLVLAGSSGSTPVTSHSGQGPAFRAAPHQLVVGVGSAVGFIFEYSDVQTNGCQLSSYSRLEVTLPVSDASSKSVALNVQSCSASVSAIVSSTIERSQFS